MKIGYIIPSCSVSGGMAVICQHGNRLLKRGHSVVFISINKKNSMDWFPNQNVPIVEATTWNSELDLLVATGWSTAFWLTRIKAQVKCYFVQSDETRFHSEESRWWHLTSLTYYLRVNYLTEARWIRKWLKNCFGHEAQLIPNGLDPEIFHYDIPLEPKGDKPRILLEGAIGLPYKGMKEAFEAVRNIDAEIWCVSSYGTPDPSWKCDRYFEQVPMQEMRRIYSSCDILLKLSRVEGFFGPPMEMMACGGAVVVGKVTGYDEYIIKGKNALVVDATDIDAAENAVRELIRNKALWTSLVTEGKRTAEHWEWEKSIDTLEDYYKNLMSSPKNWYSDSLQGRHDSSISYIYNIMSKGILPGEINDSRNTRTIPPHAQALAARIASTRLFSWIADITRITYHVYRSIKRRASSIRSNF